MRFLLFTAVLVATCFVGTLWLASGQLAPAVFAERLMAAFHPRSLTTVVPAMLMGQEIIAAPTLHKNTPEAAELRARLQRDLIRAAHAAKADPNRPALMALRDAASTYATAVRSHPGWKRAPGTPPNRTMHTQWFGTELGIAARDTMHQLMQTDVEFLQYAALFPGTNIEPQTKPQKQKTLADGQIASES